MQNALLEWEVFLTLNDKHCVVGLCIPLRMPLESENLESTAVAVGILWLPLFLNMS